jgi:hypothetical protein
LPIASKLCNLFTYSCLQYWQWYSFIPDFRNRVFSLFFVLGQSSQSLLIMLIFPKDQILLSLISFYGVSFLNFINFWFSPWYFLSSVFFKSFISQCLLNITINSKPIYVFINKITWGELRIGVLNNNLHVHCSLVEQIHSPKPSFACFF